MGRKAHHCLYPPHTKAHKGSGRPKDGLCQANPRSLRLEAEINKVTQAAAPRLLCLMFSPCALST